MSNRDALERARAAWKHRGARRPGFAIPPGPDQESVWDFPRPPRIDAVEAPVRVVHGDETVAESRAALRVVETASAPVYFIPPQDVQWSALTDTGEETLCEWKGHARYWTVRAGGRLSERAAFSYADPFPEFAAIRGCVAFYASRVDACFLGAERVTPQPGGFYAGWVTSRVVGPFKGEPGTGHW